MSSVVLNLNEVLVKPRKRRWRLLLNRIWLSLAYVWKELSKPEPKNIWFDKANNPEVLYNRYRINYENLMHKH